MPGATVLGDICSGHGSFPPRPVISASGNVIINGKGAVRIGDAVDCGSTSMGASPNVIIGG